MYKNFVSLLSICIAVLILQGCAAAVVGGAAATAAVAHDRRTTGTIVEDQSIELKIYDLMSKDSRFKQQSSIHVTSYNLVVLLTGQAADQALRSKAEQMASSVDRVRRVVNEIEIGSTSTLVENSRDAALTTEVKVRLAKVQIPGFDPLRVKVVTERGAVFLLGLITKKEADAVTDVVRHISGVRRVVRVFEYI
ncbi:MAG: BON domain-containing protein [Candidatus Thiodiazotropha sp. (ex Lucina aurantia)]|uniref:Outer membrane lipoprotein n=2 Tax=Candidatus Thiodiazotropha TaxID=1913444 RepID=A0A7Z1AHV2_9GAMM|nr:BON domain-containing protein [Candidatus Thiodiazotropha endolucinida]MBT3012533.1 BON domain-containing protein [Candidatus Thiodiazotropha sp. (ex Lucina pensylvanica)]MBT3017777.1 BON domain-containing protein [Candidatus Thiodiazotropha taylori]MBT3038893.1 BON domain-containing protein [Candidatus Thiodiazotropha sp. (ex Codakia orbicularis)]MBV2104821.1 BON domain-containing protein [Candidatus Thiodiazotropha sp. (ex Lucina aurantia)]MCU7942438.1 BON domain-containing protein [Candi